MSDIYFQEPPTSGKVVLNTTHGELDIELWCDETPRACRNFIQLCLEEYYDNTIFHRMVPQFMIQGGDPTGTGRGGDSIYGKPFLDEFHQRLKFNHRGLVAMANSGVNDNRSQFFITFDPCAWLDKKHTIFGKVVGDTVYNLMSMQNIETDKNDRPTNPPKILSTKVLINPFDDIFVRHNTRKQKEEEERQKKLKEESKGKKSDASKKKKKNVNLLSFADDEDAEDIVGETATESAKIVSSHDVLKDPKLSSQPVISQEELERRAREKEEAEKKKSQLKSKVHEATERTHHKDEPQEDLSFDQQMRKNLKDKIRVISKENPDANVKIPQSEENAELMNFTVRLNKETGKREYHWEGKKESGSSESSSSSDESSEDEQYANEGDKKLRQKQKQEYNNLRVEMLQFKKDKLGSNNADIAEKNRQEKRLLSNLELRKQKFLQDKKTKRHADDVEDKLKAFQKKVNASQSGEGNWMSNKLKFHIDSARAYSHFENKEKAGGFVREDDREDRQEIRRTTEDEQGQRVRVDVLGIDDIIKMTE